MTKSERLYEAITNLRDEFVEEALRPIPATRKKRHWARWGALAAALVLVVGIAGFYVSVVFRGAGSAAPEGTANGSANGDSLLGTSDTAGAGFLSYAGPVLSLSLAEADPEITGVRTVTWDFLPWEDPTVLDPGYVYSSSVLVTDETVLTNSGTEDKTVTVLYPFVSSLRDLDETQPALSLDGAVLDAELYAGTWAGGFAGAGGPEDEGRWNLSGFRTWEQYQELLSDGSYRAFALTAQTDLSDIPVVVYEFTGHTAPSGSGDAPAPTLGVYFELDFETTTVLGYGFNGAMWDQEGGWMIRDYFVPQPGDQDEEMPRYLIVLGGDLENISLQGYRDGACETGNELEGVSAHVERYETDLATALRTVKAVDDAAETYGEESGLWRQNGTRVSELHFEAVCRLLLDYGLLSEDPAERYDDGRLDDILWEAGTMTRVLYLEAEVTVPAGGSVAVTAELQKEASFDFAGSGSGREGLCGYETAITPDGLLEYTGMTLQVVNGSRVAITGQNCGLTLEGDTASAAVDPGGGCYYIEAVPRDS